jgi:hypothetical protein
MIDVPLLAVAALAVLGQGHHAVAARPAGERAEIEMAQGQQACPPQLHTSFLPVYHPDTGEYAVVAVQVRRNLLPCPDTQAMPSLDVTVRMLDSNGAAIAEGRGRFTSAQEEAKVLLDRPVSASSVARVQAVAQST